MRNTPLPAIRQTAPSGVRTVEDENCPDGALETNSEYLVEQTAADWETTGKAHARTIAHFFSQLRDQENITGAYRQVRELPVNLDGSIHDWSERRGLVGDGEDGSATRQRLLGGEASQFGDVIELTQVRQHEVTGGAIKIMSQEVCQTIV